MAAWCLVPEAADRFLKALADGTLAPDRLLAMSSIERRAAFADVVGEENAAEVNAQFEAKMLLQDQKRGLITWAKKIGGITEPARRDIISQINRMNKVLQPEDEDTFLADLAAKRLGVSVTADEAKEIFDLSQTATRLREQITAAGEGDYRKGWTPETGTAYGRASQALIDKIQSLKPHGMTLQNGLLQALNLSREALTSVFHWSAPFVQLVGMIGTKQWARGLGKQFQYFADEANYANLIGWMHGHPDFEIAQQAKLGITQLGGKLTASEEDLQSHLLLSMSEYLTERSGVANLVRGAPAPVRAVLGGDANLIRAWQRSFVGVCNYVRFSRFTAIADAARLQGTDVSVGSKAADDIAQVVNNFTGRGNLGAKDSAAMLGVYLNNIFFSPRKLVATMEMFNPVMYARLSPVARNAAIKQIAGFLLVTGSVLMLARFAGAKVSLNPVDTNFAKINIGGDKLDMTGGNASYLRLLARVATGHEITAHGKVVDLDGDTPHGATRADMVVNFLRDRLAPNAAIVADALYGRNPIGQPFNVLGELSNKFTPIVIDDFIKHFENNPDDWAAVGPDMSALLGVSLESPEPPISESGRDVWGDPLPPFGTPKSWSGDPVNREAQRVGLNLTFPQDKIRGQKLTPQQFDDYSRLAGRLAHQRLEDVVGSDGWASLPPQRRLGIMRSVITKSRDAAATSIMIQAQGGPNDIMAKATAAKLAAMSAAPEPVQ